MLRKICLNFFQEQQFRFQHLKEKGGGAYIRTSLCTEGNLRFKIDQASLILGRKFTVFLCFTLYLRAISKYKPPGGLYLEGRFNGGFFALRVWGAYIWRGLFSEFYGISETTRPIFFKSLHIIFIMYITMFETYIKINSLQHLEISRQTYLTGL